MDFDLSSILGVLTSLITGLVGFFVGKGKRQAETENLEIDNLKEIINIQQSTIEYLKKEILELRSEIEELKKKN